MAGAPAATPTKARKANGPQFTLRRFDGFKRTDETEVTLPQRIDKWLCYARFVKHRSTASELIEAGHIRINRAKIQKSSHVVKPFDILTIAMHDDVRVIRVLAEAERRGPAPEARLLYEELKTEAPAQNMGA